MKYKIINNPIYVPRNLYFEAIGKITEYLSKHSQVKSIYRLGNITDPGISDIDILVIFKDGMGLKDEPRKVLDETGHYLFTHSLFGISESLLKYAIKYSVFHNYEYLWGVKIDSQSLTHTVDKKIESQIALEYLLKLFISLSIQKSAGILKLRPFLLESKAVKFDLDIIGEDTQKMRHTVEKIIDIRNKWFENKPCSSEIISLHELFYTQLNQLLVQLSAKLPFYVDNTRSVFKFGKNLSLSNGKIFNYNTKCRIPNLTDLIPSKMLPYYLKLFNKTSNHHFIFPMQKAGKDNIISRKNEYEKNAQAFLKKYAPAFIPMKSPLNLHKANNENC
jgi:hypothetical protein